MNSMQQLAADAYQDGGPEAYDAFLLANRLQVYGVTHAVTGEFFGEFVASSAAQAIADCAAEAGYQGAEAAMFAEDLSVET